jgi:mRNA interferase RelE/StbE/toxin YoeB
MNEAVFSDEFKKQLEKLKKKNAVLFERIQKKIKQILLEPNRFKHLRNMLKGEQRVHFGSFVLRFSVKENKVYFITFKHHNDVY